MTISNMPLEWLPLVDSIIKATLILVLAACASLALRRASAAVRHLVWTLALCSAIALPILTATLPKWHLPLVRIAADAPATHAVLDVEESVALVAQPRLEKSTAIAIVDAAPVASTPEPFTVRARAIVASITWQQALLGLWLAGALAIFARLAIGLLAMLWLSRRTQEITDAPWLPLARALAAHVGVTPRLRFLRSANASMPVAAGIIRPSVIMPADADTWSESRLRIVLLHELAHVKRRDCLTHLLAQVACACYWFNPLAWMAAKRARTERERACDDLVLACGTRSSEYADELLGIARSMRSHRLGGLMAGVSLAMAHRSQLEGRLIAILDPKLPRAGVSRGRGLAAIAICCCAVAPLGAMQPWTENAVIATSSALANAVAGENDVPTTVDDGRVGAATLSASERSTVANPTAAERRRQPADSQGEQPDQPLQPPSPVQPPQPPTHPVPSDTEVGRSPAAIAQATADGVAERLDYTVEKSVEYALQDPKPKPGKEGDRQADPRMVAALTAALKDPDKEVRETAMQALINMRDPAIFEPLLLALKDSSPEVREQAAAGLGRMRDRRAIEPLVSALKDENADVRQQVVFALGQLRDRVAVPGLMIALKDSSADVREQAAFALGQLRDAAAVEGLGVAVRDSNPGVRQQAVFALGQIRDRRAVEPLISALKDSSADVREQAAFALGQLRDRAAVDALVIAVKDADADVRQQVVFALGQIRDPRAIDALTTALKDQSADVRQQAAFALGQLAR